MQRCGCCSRTPPGQVHPDAVFLPARQGFVVSAGQVSCADNIVVVDKIPCDHNKICDHSKIPCDPNKVSHHDIILFDQIKISHHGYE